MQDNHKIYKRLSLKSHNYNLRKGLITATLPQPSLPAVLPIPTPPRTPSFPPALPGFLAFLRI